MDASLFEDFFNATVIRKDTKPYTAEQLKGRVDAMVDKLLSLKRNNWDEYAFLFAKYGEASIRRISFYNRKMVDAGASEDINLAKKYLSAHNDFLKSLKALDRALYERKLRGAIQKGKATKKQEIIKERVESPHSNIERLTESKLTEENARNLYHHLIAENWIRRDAPENDFIYYFTADCGSEPVSKLHWNTNDSLLGLVLYRIVKNRIPWKKLDLIFDNLPPNMRQTVAQKKKSQYLDEALAKIDKWISSSD